MTPPEPTRFELTYTLGPRERLALYAVEQPTAYRQYRNRRFVTSAWALALVAAGLFSALHAKITAFAVLFAIAGVALVGRIALSRRQFEALTQSVTAAQPSRDVRLVVDDDGLKESSDGIESFAPWRVVRSFADVDQTLLLRLGAGMWAAIPQAAFAATGDGSLEAFRAMLVRRGIPGKGW